VLFGSVQSVLVMHSTHLPLAQKRSDPVPEQAVPLAFMHSHTPRDGQVMDTTLSQVPCVGASLVLQAVHSSKVTSMQRAPLPSPRSQQSCVSVQPSCVATSQAGGMLLSTPESSPSASPSPPASPSLSPSPMAASMPASMSSSGILLRSNSTSCVHAPSTSTAN